MNEQALNEQVAAPPDASVGGPVPPAPDPGPRFPEPPAGRVATEPIRLSSPSGSLDRSKAARSRRRAPVVVTGAVLAGTLVVVGAATWVAQQPEPAPVAAPSVAPVRLTRTSTAPDPAGAGAPIQIEVGTPDASALLAVPQHRWTTRRPDGTRRLMVRVRLSVRSGALSYDPTLVTLFDARGRVYRNAVPLGTPGELGSGRLGAGSSADGWVGFDVRPGTTTLVLSDWRGASLAAVRIPA